MKHKKSSYKLPGSCLIICNVCLALLLIVSFDTVDAQQAIAAAGGDATGPGGTVNFSVAQVFFLDAASASGSVSQGVQQPLTLSVLPITLVSFQATATNNETVLVQWQTASEINNKLFTVEKSVNGISFESALRLEASSNSSTIKKYSWVDTEPYAGISYYRLKQTDYNNAVAYSDIRAVNINGVLKSITIYPNPVHEDLTVKMRSGETLTCNIFDQSGRLIKSKILVNTTSKIDVSSLLPATYIIQFIDGNDAKQFKLIKN